MELKHIELDQLKTTNLNVRKKGGKDIDDLVPSIRSLGVIQPLLVRSNCEGFEVVAGQRRYNALVKISEEQTVDPVPCIVMDDGDDARAIEASLAENIARLPMDEIDQYRAFAALAAKGLSLTDIASQFGVSEKLVKQRLAIANLIAPILTLYRKEEIDAATIRSLTLASKRQQKEWLALHNSDDEYAPLGRDLKDWLFGGAQILVSNALFDVAAYEGAIISDLFGDNQYFSDSDKFWPFQSQAIAQAKETYLLEGWQDVVVMERGAYWSPWELRGVPKEDGGRVYIQVANNGEVSFHEGYLTEKEAKRLEQQTDESGANKPERPELTKPMQNYLDLHRHAAVRSEMLSHPDLALRLAVANIIASSSLWQCRAEPQKAASEAITTSLSGNKAEAAFAKEREHVRTLLGIEEADDETLVPRKDDWGKSRDLNKVFAALLKLEDEAVSRVLTFVVAETLPSGSATVEVIGNRLGVDMGEVWALDEAFLDLLRDKEAINAVLSELGGKQVASANIASTAKLQKQIIGKYLDGTRTLATKGWKPRYMGFPMCGYTKRGGIAAIDGWQAVKKHFG
jgi:ParB family chromosome partitioning protein